MFFLVWSAKNVGIYTLFWFEDFGQCTRFDILLLWKLGPWRFENLNILTCSSSSKNDKFELEDEMQSCSVERDDSLCDLRQNWSRTLQNCHWKNHLWHERRLGWGRLARYWRKEGVREFPKTSNVIERAPLPVGPTCLLNLFCSSFSKNLHLASISASSPKRKFELLATFFSEPLQPFQEAWEMISTHTSPPFSTPSPSSIPCKVARETHGRNWARGMWWALAT